jgi:hypothetical protein
VSNVDPLIVDAHIILTRDGMRSCLYVAGLGAQVWFEQFRLRLRPGTCSYVDALQVLCVLCSDHTRNIYMPYPVRVRDGMTLMTITIRV